MPLRKDGRTSSQNAGAMLWGKKSTSRRTATGKKAVKSISTKTSKAKARTSSSGARKSSARKSVKLVHSRTRH